MEKVAAAGPTRPGNSVQAVCTFFQHHHGVNPSSTCQHTAISTAKGLQASLPMFTHISHTRSHATASSIWWDNPIRPR
jgi:hypothetical protein